MKAMMGFLTAVLCVTCTSCEKSAASNNDNVNQNGVVKGRVTDSRGNAIANAKVVIENTVFYASYVHTTTNTEGYYNIEVPNGSWKASVQIERAFAGIDYKFDLCANNSDPFAGTTGATRNFTWKLKGVRPEGNGFFGSNVILYTEPGSEFTANDVELTLTPDGPLPDGTSGGPIIGSTVDIGGGEDGIPDVPIGKYKVTAVNKNTGQPLQIRLRSNGNYETDITTVFKSGFTGVTTYQMVLQVK